MHSWPDKWGAILPCEKEYEFFIEILCGGSWFLCQCPLSIWLIICIITSKSNFLSLQKTQKKKKKKKIKYPLSRSKLDPLLLFGIIVDSTVLRRNFVIESFNRKSDNMLNYNTYPSRIKCIEVLTFNIHLVTKFI